MVIWPQIAGFLLVGYLCMSRSFAYLGVAPLFIGEIVLGAFLLLKPRVALGTWAASLLRASPLNELDSPCWFSWHTASGRSDVASSVAALSSTHSSFSFLIITRFIYFLGSGLGCEPMNTYRK